MTQNRSQRLIVGMTGRSQSGKDTFGRRLVEDHGFAQYAFADRLKLSAKGADPLIPVDHPHLYGLALSDQVLPFGGGSQAPNPHLYRLSHLVDVLGWDRTKEVPEAGRTLQRIGTEGGWQVHGPLVWVDLVEKAFEAELDEGVPVVITDLRFPHEEEWLRQRGGVLVKVVRPEQERVSTRDQAHASEKGQDLLTPDFAVQNDGTLQEFYGKVDDIARDVLLR